MPFQKFQCSNKKLAILQRETPAGIEVKAVYTTCKTWKCPECSQRKVLELRNRIYRFFYKKTIYHYTFTIKQYGQSESSARHHLKKSFDRFRKRIARLYNHFDYIYFFEIGKAGNFHYHLLSSTAIKWRDLRWHWRGSTRNSMICYRTTFASGKGVIRKYVAKYVQKQALAHGGASFCGHRFYSHSRHFYRLAKIVSGWKLVEWVDSVPEAVRYMGDLIADLIVEFSDSVRGSPHLFAMNDDFFCHSLLSYI